MLIKGVISASIVRTRLIILTHASNVTGTVLPVKEVGKIAREYQIPFLVDAAQTIGCYEIDVEKQNIDLLAFSGHKGLLGPQGTGGLYVREEVDLRPLRHGGTGSQSERDTQPEFLPDKYESGTLNTPGIAGLGTGVDFILKETVTKISEHERGLALKLINGLKGIEGITIYGFQEPDRQIANISFNLKNYNSQEVSDALSQVFGITTRGGLHCSPWAHRVIGTYPTGTVRISPGYFNKEEDIEKVITALKRISCLK